MADGSSYIPGGQYPLLSGMSTAATPTQQGNNLSNPNMPMVYLGDVDISSTPSSLLKPGAKKTSPKYVPFDYALTMANSLNGAQVQKVMDIAEQRYGYRPSEIQGFNSTWEYLVGLSKDIELNDGVAVQPLDAYDYWRKTRGVTADTFAGGANGAGGGGGGPTASRTETVDFTDPMSAKTIVNQTLSSYLGRTATDQEYNAFASALRAAEEANPTITESQSSISGGVARQTTQREGGMNAQSFADAWARGQEGSAEYNAATNLMKAFEEAIVGSTL